MSQHLRAWIIDGISVRGRIGGPDNTPSTWNGAILPDPADNRMPCGIHPFVQRGQ